MISAVVMPAPGKPLELRDFEEPEPEPGAVLLKTLGSEVCGTDTHLWKGQLAGVPIRSSPGMSALVRLPPWGRRPLAAMSCVTYPVGPSKSVRS